LLGDRGVSILRYGIDRYFSWRHFDEWASATEPFRMHCKCIIQGPLTHSVNVYVMSCKHLFWGEPLKAAAVVVLVVVPLHVIVAPAHGVIIMIEASWIAGFALRPSGLDAGVLFHGWTRTARLHPAGA
jgi:hypothetical protein